MYVDTSTYALLYLIEDQVFDNIPQRMFPPYSSFDFDDFNGLIYLSLIRCKIKRYGNFFLFDLTKYILHTYKLNLYSYKFIIYIKP